MTIEKTFGFAGASPYNSETFNNYSRQVFRRNGLIDPPKSIEEDFPNNKITLIGGCRFLQRGLIIAKTDVDVVVDIPEGLEAPYYLVGTTPDNIVRDNVVFTFSKSPQELGESHVIIAAYDGVEWRFPSLVTIDGLIKHREYSNRTYGHSGFNTGFGFSHDPAYTTYTLAPGDITDKVGMLQPLYESRTLDAIATDVDFNRIDLIVFRRCLEHYQRIGMFEVIAGPCMVSSEAVRATPIKQQTLGSFGSTCSAVKILQGPNNTLYLSWCEGLGTDNGTVYLQIMDDTRTAVVLGPVSVVSGVSMGMYDLAIDEDGNVGFFFVRNMTNLLGGDVYFTRISSTTGLVLTAPTPVESVSIPFASPKIVYDRLGYYHILAYSFNGGVRSLTYLKTNTSGAVASPARDILPGIEISTFSVDLDPEFHVHIAYQRVSDGYIYYAELDDVGEVLKTIVVDTGLHPQIYFTANKEVYISYERSQWLYTWRYQSDTLAPSLREYPTGISRRDPYLLTGVTYHRGYVDPVDNLHLLYANGTGLYETTIGLPTNEARTVPALLNATWAGYNPYAAPGVGSFDINACDIIYDTNGALYIACAKVLDTFSVLGSPIDAPYFGQGIYGTENVGIAASEFLITDSDYVTQFPGAKPSPGDKLVISGSAIAGNNGTFYINSWRDVTINGVLHKAFALITSGGTPVTFTGEVSATALAQFYYRDGERVKSSKMAPLTSYDFSDAFSRELESDMIYGLVKKPSNDILLWNSVVRVEAAGFVQHDSIFVTSGNIIKLDTGLLTWLGDIVLKDPMHFQLTIPAGSVSMVNDDVLFAYLPTRTLFESDGDGAGVNQTVLADTLGLSPGMQVFVGDSDSAGITCTITSISDRTITTDVSLVDYRADRGAYVSVLTGQLYKEKRNTGALRPASDGTIDQRIYVIAYMSEDLVFFRNGALTLQDKEEGHLGEGPTEDLLAYIGATSEVDNDPNYSNNYGGTQGESLTTRLGAVDLRAYEAAQDRNIWDLRSIDLEFDFDSMSETITWNVDWFIMVPNVGTVVPHTIATATKSMILLDNEVAYVTVSRAAGAGDLPVNVCAAGALPLNSSTRAHIVIARRKGTSVMLGRFGQVVLDITASSLAQHQEKTFKLIGGGTWEWSATALTCTQDAYIQAIGLPNARNRIVAGTFYGLAADGDILYVDINRKGTTPATLAVTAGNIATTVKGPHRVILARRVGANVYVGNMQLEENVRSLLERPYTEQAQIFIGQPTANEIIHDYGNSVYLEAWMSHERALAELDYRIQQFFSLYPQMTPFRYYIWPATASQTSFVIGTGGYGDSSIRFSTSHLTREIVVLREGLKQQQSLDGVWPIVNANWHYRKVSDNTLEFKQPLADGEKVTIIYCNNVYPPIEYVWEGDGVEDTFDLGTPLEGPGMVLPFQPSNGVADIMVWLEQYQHFCSIDSLDPIPDDVTHHDFYKVSSTTIKFKEAPRAGELVVLRLGLPYETQWGECHWYADNITDTFEVGVSSYGNSNIKWSTDVLIYDVHVAIDGITLEPNVDYIKLTNSKIQMLYVPTSGSKITARAIDLHVITNPLNILQDGTLVTSETTEIDFRGTGVVVTKPGPNRARVTITGGGGGGGGNTLIRTNGDTVTIPAYKAVCFNATGQLLLADSTIVGRKNPVGISLEEITVGDSGAFQVGGIIPDVLLSLGFNWTDEVFLGFAGALVNVAGIPNTGSPTDGIIKLGDVGGSSLAPTDLIWNKQDLGGW